MAEPTITLGGQGHGTSTIVNVSVTIPAGVLAVAFIVQANDISTPDVSDAAGNVWQVTGPVGGIEGSATGFAFAWSEIVNALSAQNVSIGDGISLKQRGAIIAYCSPYVPYVGGSPDEEGAVGNQDDATPSTQANLTPAHAAHFSLVGFAWADNTINVSSVDNDLVQIGGNEDLTNESLALFGDFKEGLAQYTVTGTLSANPGTDNSGAGWLFVDAPRTPPIFGESIANFPRPKLRYARAQRG